MEKEIGADDYASNTPVLRISDKLSGRYNLGEILFLFAYFIFFIRIACDASDLVSISKTVNNIFTVLVISFASVKLLMQRYTPLRFIITLLLLFVILFSCILSGKNNLYMLSVMLIAVMQDVDFNKLLKLSCLSKAVLIFLHVYWYIVVYFSNPSVINYVYRGTTNEKRHYFFLGHSNLFTAFLAWMLLEFIYIHYKKLNILHLVAIWLITLMFYQFTASNTGFIVISFSIALVLWDKFTKKSFDKMMSPVVKYGHAICSFLFPALAVCYTSLSPSLKQLWLTLNHFFSGRLWYGAHAYDVYGATFIGRNLTFPLKVLWDGKWFDTMQIFDNYYLGNFLSFGTIHLIIISAAFFLFAKKMENRDKIMIVAYIFYGAMESYVTDIIICFPLLLIGKFIYNSGTQQLVRRNPDVKPPLWKRGREIHAFNKLS